MESNPICNKKSIDNGNCNANITGTVIDLSKIKVMCVHSIFTGSPVGSLNVLASNDNINFKAVDTQSVSGASQFIYNPTVGYIYVRVDYTFTSGSGNLTSIVSGKA